MNPFLDEVLNHPHDDGPRLIYADWLEELGDPRGEFIRVQCELANTDPLDARYYELAERSEALLNKYREEWAGELNQDLRKAEFHRGFVDTITIRARAFAKEAESLFRATPVHWLRFNYVKGAGATLAALPVLRKIRSLDLSDLKIPHEDLCALLSSPHLAELQQLNLNYQNVPLGTEIGTILSKSPSCATLKNLEVIADYTNGFLKALFKGDGFPNLEHLAVGSEYRDHPFEDFGELTAPPLRSLKLRGRLTVGDTTNLSQLDLSQLLRLNAHGTGMPARGVASLAEQGAFDQIEELDLGNCDVRMSAMRSLFQGQQLGRCRRLDLSGTRYLTDAGKMSECIRLLADHAPLATLRELFLTNLTNFELKSLASSSHLQGLQSLNVQHLRLTATDAHAVSQSGWTDSLRQLGLRSAGVDLQAMEELCAAEYPNLVQLDLHGEWDLDASIDEEAVVYLIESNAFPSLRSLKLDYTHLTSKTLETIAARSSFPELRSLSFQGNRADDQCVRDVLNSEQLPKLRCLSVNNTIGMRNRPKLQAAFGSRIKT